MEIILTGNVVHGLGEAKRFLSMPEYSDQIKKETGFYPFPGTLNVRLDSQSMKRRNALDRIKPRVVHGFESNGKHFGHVSMYHARLNKKDVYVLVPEKSRYGKDIIEIISGERLELDLQKSGLVEIIVDVDKMDGEDRDE